MKSLETNSRIARLKQGLRVKQYPLCIEKIRLVAASMRQTDGEPQILRRAKALANVLRNITIFIEDGELIVGNAASKPMGLEIDSEYGIWSPAELASLKQDGYTIDPADEAELQALYRDWRSRTLVEGTGDILYDDERLWPFMQSGLVLPPWKNKVEGGGGGYAQGGMGLGPGFYLLGVDFARVLNSGLYRIIADAKAELRDLRYRDADAKKKADFLKAVIIAHEAVIAFAHRFADLAAATAEREADPGRRAELERIAATCRWVPAHPARTFYEALQSFWFVFLVICPSPTSAAGRFDQYMYPFYRDDIEAGRITDDEVLELLQCLRIKDMQINRTSGQANRAKNAGMAKWHNWTIGGVTRDGEDATNELTYLLLEAAKRCPVPHHTLTLRVHEKTPEDLLVKALEVVKQGMGLPAFVGDQAYIQFFVDRGVPLADAREYILTGCLDANIPGKSRTVAISFFIVPLAFNTFMRNGVDPNTGRQVGIQTGEMKDFRTFDEFMGAFKKQLSYLMGLAAEKNNIELLVSRELFPDPFRSSLMHDALKEGKDILDRTFPFENAAVLNPVGMINVADSLAAIKKLVFEEQTVTLDEMQAALEANWEGYEHIRQLCLRAPKYGNDNDYVDSIAAELYQFWADTCATLDTVYWAKHIPTAISITTHQPGGQLSAATPDGRYARQILADGTMSPMQGRDVNGPTSVLKSAIKIDQTPYQATLMNMKFHPSALETTEDLRKLAALMRTYFTLGGKHLQFNVVTKEILLAAQRQPEDYQDLVVRIAGYSCYFVQLSRAMQDEVIARTEHDAMG